MTLLSAIKQKSTETIVIIAVTGCVSYLLRKLDLWRLIIVEKLARPLQNHITYEFVLCTAVLEFVVIVCLFLYILRSKAKLYPKYGVFWDSGGNSYCPRCKGFTSQLDWVAYDDKQWKGLKCPCTVEPFLFIDKGEPLKGEDVMRQMKK